MIFFTHVNTQKLVHAMALGFTSSVFYHVEANNDKEAAHKVENYLLNKHNLITKTRTVSIAIHQNKEQYCFPECIVT